MDAPPLIRASGTAIATSVIKHCPKQTNNIVSANIGAKKGEDGQAEAPSKTIKCIQYRIGKNILIYHFFLIVHVHSEKEIPLHGH